MPAQQSQPSARTRRGAAAGLQGDSSEEGVHGLSLTTPDCVAAILKVPRNRSDRQVLPHLVRSASIRVRGKPAPCFAPWSSRHIGCTCVWDNWTVKTHTNKRRTPGVRQEEETNARYPSERRGDVDQRLRYDA